MPIKPKFQSILVFLLIVMTIVIGFNSTLYANSDLSNEDIDKLTTYAVILGRAIGCGISTEYESKRVGKWIDSKCPPGSSKQKTYLPIFINGVKYHAQQQASGKSPDTCSQVRRTFNDMPWP